MGAVVGTCSDMRSSINVDQAQEMIFGYVLLNDWSARGAYPCDVQGGPCIEQLLDDLRVAAVRRED